MIETDDLTRLDERYVKKDDCNNMMSLSDGKIDELKTDIAIIKTRQSTLITILSMIAVPVVAIAIKLLFGGA